MGVLGTKDGISESCNNGKVSDILKLSSYLGYKAIFFVGDRGRLLEYGRVCFFIVWNLYVFIVLL